MTLRQKRCIYLVMLFEQQIRNHFFKRADIFIQYTLIMFHMYIFKFISYTQYLISSDTLLRILLFWQPWGFQVCKYQLFSAINTCILLMHKFIYKPKNKYVGVEIHHYINIYWNIVINPSCSRPNIKYALQFSRLSLTGIF